METPSDYLNRTVWATLGVSKIHGVGCIALRDIPMLTVLSDNMYWEAKRPPFFSINTEEFFKILPEIQKLIIDRNSFEKDSLMTFASPNFNACLQSFMNHSDTPNSDGTYAILDIRAGEEITENFHLTAKNPHYLTEERNSTLI